jgi:hypothetical protein
VAGGAPPTLERLKRLQQLIEKLKIKKTLNLCSPGAAAVRGGLAKLPLALNVKIITTALQY